MTRRALSVAGVGGLGIVMLVLATTSIGHAQVAVFPTSDRPAGYVVFPKVVVDVLDVFSQGRLQDTFIQLTNTGQDARVVECFYVDASNRCNNALSGDVGQFRYCRTTADCRPGGQCLPQWSQTDFTIVVTPDQPVGWRANAGTDLSKVDAASDGIVKPVGPYFIGELKCFEVDGTSIVNTTTTPILANDLKGEASIYDTRPSLLFQGPAGVDVREYNGVGFQARAQVLTGKCVGGNNAGTACATSSVCTGGGTCAGGQALCLGASPGSGTPPGRPNCTVAAYAACPSILVLDHFFDGAEDPDIGGVVTTDVTLAPCTEDLTQAQGANGVSSQTPTTAQILVFNEFEQRLSAAVNIDCFKETQLSQIDQTPGNQKSSAFSAAVQGTLTGQTRIRPILSSDPNAGNGLIAVAEEFHCSTPDPSTGSCAGERSSLHHSAAFNVNYIGTNGVKGDIVSYSVTP